VESPAGALPQPVVNAMDAASTPVAIVGRNVIVFIVFPDSKPVSQTWFVRPSTWPSYTKQAER